MRYFLFNEITPADVSNVQYSESLANTLVEYKHLKNIYQNAIDGIITSTAVGNISFRDNYTLHDSLQGISSLDIRNFGYGVLTKFPIEMHLQIDDVLALGIEHYFVLDAEEKDAIYLKILFDVKGFAFSLNLHDDLSKDILSIFSQDKEHCYLVNNLYGLKENTENIKLVIQKDEESKLGNFEKLLSILNGPIYSKKLEHNFKRESNEVQCAILDTFSTVIDNLAKGVVLSEKLLKDVTPLKETKFTIKELKIRDPRAKRLYFSIVEGMYYLASLEDKPLKDRKTKEQDAHIKNAHSTLYQWLF